MKKFILILSMASLAYNVSAQPIPAIRAGITSGNAPIDYTRFYHMIGVFEGNSIMYAITYSGTSITAELVKKFPFNAGAAITNTGTNGNTTPQLIARGATTVDVLLTDTTKFNIASILEGTNDVEILQNSADTCIAHFKKWISDRKAAHWKHVGIYTVLPNGQGYGVRIDSINTSIRANHAAWGADVLFDIAIDPRMSNPADTSIYNSDQLHPKTAGDVIMGEITRRVLLLVQ